MVNAHATHYFSLRTVDHGMESESAEALIRFLSRQKEKDLSSRNHENTKTRKMTTKNFVFFKFRVFVIGFIFLLLNAPILQLRNEKEYPGLIWDA